MKKGNKKTKKGSYSPTQRIVITHARRNGLYVLFEGSMGKYRWRVYDSKTGSVLADYWPDSSRCNCYVPVLFTFVQPDWAELMKTLRLVTDQKRNK
jgi:hypothetical protein